MRRRDLTIPLFFTIVFCLILVSFQNIGVEDGQSALINRAWHAQFSSLIAQGHFWPRFAPDLAFGFGAMDLFFYAPLPFYVTSTIGELLAFSSGSDASLASGAAVILCASGVTFYMMAREFAKRNAALMGTLIYLFAPYHFWVDWLMRQAIGELCAFVFLPLVILGLSRVSSKRGGEIALLVGLVGLAYSHLPSLMIAGLTLGPSFLLINYMSNRKDLLKNTLRVLAISGLSAGLSAPYWLPALSEIGHFSIDLMRTDTQDGLLPCLNCMGSVFERAIIVLSATYIMLIAWLWFRLPKSERARERQWILIPAACAIYFMTVLSWPLWGIDVLNIVQFSWRFLIIIDVSICLGLVIYIDNRIAPEFSIKQVLGSGVCLAIVAVALNLVASKRVSYELEMTAAPEYGHFKQVDMILAATRVTRPDATAFSYTYVLGEHLAGFGQRIERDNFAKTVSKDHREMIFEAAAPNAGLPLFFNPLFEVADEAGQAIAFEYDALGVMRVKNPAPGKIFVSLPVLASERIGLWGGAVSALLGLLLLLARRISRRRKT